MDLGKGLRKVVLGIGFLFCGTILASRGIDAKMDGMGIGLMLGGLASGVGVIIWGNVQEYRHTAALPKDPPQS